VIPISSTRWQHQTGLRPCYFNSVLLNASVWQLFYFSVFL